MLKTFIWPVFVLTLALTLISESTLPGVGVADEVYTFVLKKQEEKAKTGWNLSDWLATRDTMRLQDLWLALHSPSPYEFFLSGDYQFDQGYTASRFTAGAYASIFGLQAEVENADPDHSSWNFNFNFRVFGYHAQGTNITLQAGLRSETEGFHYRNAFGGVDFTLYFTRFFGVEGIYRHFFDSVPNSNGITVNGNRYEGSAFIDFRFLRVFGAYFSEPSTYTSSAAATMVSVTRSGALIGTMLFF